MITQEQFQRLADQVQAGLPAGDDATLWLRAEDSDFVRFNRGLVRQPGTVDQADLRLRRIRGARHASLELSLSGDPGVDLARVEEAMARLGALVDRVPEDPHLLWAVDGRSTCFEAPGAPADALSVTDEILGMAQGLDMVGILVSGRVLSGFASSRGQRCWDQRHSLLFDWCLYHREDKAVKSTLGSTGWDPAELATAMDAARSRLRLLDRPVKQLQPGRYRCVLDPAALGEIVDLVCWGGFSERAHRTRNTPLLRMLTEGEVLSPAVSLHEDNLRGLGPAFSGDGFHRPDSVPLIEEGRLAGTLVSPRSAREYGIPTTGAAEDESPSSLVMAPGELSDRALLDRLGTGLYISNLWYLNWSDRAAGRMTGMTRFATLWVEDGEIVAPTEVMRFDDSLFHVLGSGLEGLTDSLALRPSTSTYERRATGSQRLPGALVDGMTFTL